MGETFEKLDYTNFNFPAVSDMVSEWSNAVSLFQGSYKKASDDSTFKVLEKLEFSNGFPVKFDDVMESLATSVNGFIAELNSYIDELAAQDEELGDELPDPPRGGNNFGADSGDSLGDGYSPVQENQGEGKDNFKEQNAYLSDISLSDLQNIVDMLNTIATDNKLNIDQLLNDETLGAKIKETFLKNVKLSETYRDMIEEGSSVSLVTSLKSLLNGDLKDTFGLDEDTELTLKSYLINIAKDNNLEYSDLIDTEANSKVLKKALSSMKKINPILSSFTKENVQSSLLAIYDGDLGGTTLDETSQDIIRSNIDILSSATDINYEELLTEPEYAGEMLNVTERLQRTALYAELLSNCKSSSSILSSLGKKVG